MCRTVAFHSALSSCIGQQCSSTPAVHTQSTCYGRYKAHTCHGSHQDHLAHTLESPQCSIMCLLCTHLLAHAHNWEHLTKTSKNDIAQSHAFQYSCTVTSQITHLTPLQPTLLTSLNIAVLARACSYQWEPAVCSATLVLRPSTLHL
eukprot:jgi/Ulvmu1/2482/UM137_0008.1